MSIDERTAMNDYPEAPITGTYPLNGFPGQFGAAVHCPICGHTHHHSAALGHREAHCSDTATRTGHVIRRPESNGYVITDPAGHLDLYAR